MDTTLGAILLGYPLFFTIFRMSVFNTVPRDDYAPYVLWLVGDPGGSFLPSPYSYRLFSVLAALPFYKAMPQLALTNIPPGLSLAWIQATSALSAVATVSLLLAAFATAVIAVRQCRLSPAEGAAAGLLLLFLAFYTQITAIDGTALMLITVGIALLRRPLAFGSLIAVSVGFNEKVALVLAGWLMLRCLTSRDDRMTLWRQAVIAFVGVALYLGIVVVFHFPGNEYQRDTSGVVSTVLENLAAYRSVRGILLNVVPASVLAGLAAFGHLGGRRLPIFRAVDIMMIPVMLGVALVWTHLFQAGRLAMHTAPLFVIPAISALSAYIRPAR